MSDRPRRTRRRRAGLVALALLVLVVGAGGVGVWRHERSGQAMRIPDGRSGDAAVPVPAPTPTTSSAPPGQPRFVTTVGEDGRHFTDQYGDPVLVHGDAPWSLLTDLSPAQAELYLRDREEHGYNAALVSLIGAEANGGPADDARTSDGLRPFVEGDVTA